MRPAKLDWVRNEITRMRGQLRAQEREIRMLRRAGMSTASAELLLSRMRAKVDDLCREREALRKARGLQRTYFRSFISRAFQRRRTTSSAALPRARQVPRAATEPIRPSWKSP